MKTFHDMALSTANISGTDTSNNTVIQDFFKRQIERLQDFYGSTNYKRPERWADELIGMKYTTKSVELAVNHCVNFIEKFPSFAEFTSILRSKQSVKPQTEDTLNKQFQVESDRFNKLKSQLLEKFGEDFIRRYVQYWCIEVYGESFKGMVKQFGLNLSSFQKPAFFDLAEAQGDYKKAILIGKRKSRIDQQNTN